MCRIVESLLSCCYSTHALFGCSLPLAVAIFGCSPPLAVAIFGRSLPLAVAIFLVIWHFHLRQIAIFVQAVNFVRPFHRQKPQSKKTPHRFSAVSGAATKHYSHPRLRWFVFYFWPSFLEVASKNQTTRGPLILLDIATITCSVTVCDAPPSRPTRCSVPVCDAYERPLT